MNPQFLHIRNRMININAISYVRFYDELDRIDIRLVGPDAEVSLSVTVEGEEAAPERNKGVRNRDESSVPAHPQPHD